MPTERQTDIILESEFEYRKFKEEPMSNNNCTCFEPNWLDGKCTLCGGIDKTPTQLPDEVSAQIEKEAKELALTDGEIITHWRKLPDPPKMKRPTCTRPNGCIDWGGCEKKGCKGEANR